jgi:RNA polymerase sigma-70 factor (ECF subfamily)
MISKEEFKDLFNNHFDAIRSFAFYRCGDMEMASDIAQDVFLKIWERKNLLDNHKIKSLLYKMTTDYCISNYRKNKNHMDFKREMMLTKDAVLSPEEEMMYDEITNLYAQALEEMPEKRRSIFLMNRESGMKYAEIADCLNVSVKSVEKHMSNALRLLKKKLHKHTE